MKNINIIYITAGGGHLASAKALKAAIEIGHRNCHVTLTDLNSIIGHHNPLPFRPENFYNWLVAHDYVKGMGFWLKLGKKIIELKSEKIHQSLIEYFYLYTGNDDVVVSVIPNFNNHFFAAVRKQNKFITIMTDFVEYQSPTWIVNNDSRLIVPSQEAYKQALELRNNKYNVMKISGLMVHPNFYGKSVDRQDDVIVYGFGIKETMKIARRLARIEKKVLFICGNNKELYMALKAFKKYYAMSQYGVIGFVDNMPDLLHSASTLITKAGPGILSEAEVSGIKVLTNERVMMHEKYNIQYIWDKGLGYVLGNKSWKEELYFYANELVSRYYTHKMITNNGVFEAAEIVANL